MRGLIVLLVFFVVLINQIPFWLPRSCGRMGGAFLFVESGMDKPCIGYLGQTFRVNSLKVNALDCFP